MYHRSQHYGGQSKVKVQCKITYIPFEARLDRTSFELMVRETKPQNLILLNATVKQTNKISSFIASQNLHINVFSCAQ